MPTETTYTNDLFTTELNHLHDIQLLLEKLVLTLGGSSALNSLALKTNLTIEGLVTP